MGRVSGGVVVFVFVFETIFVFKAQVATTPSAPCPSPSAPFTPKIPHSAGNVIAGVILIAAATAVGSSIRMSTETEKNT